MAAQWNIRLTVLAPAIVAMSLTGSARSDPPEAPDGLRADATFADVYVNDSFEARDAIAEAQSLSARGQWSEAAEALQQIATSDGDKLIGVSPGMYVGIRNHINELIADWPREGIEAYRSLFERKIRRSLFELPVPQKLYDLLPIFDAYFCTATAARLVDTIGQLAIEAGDLALARQVYRRVLDHHPDGRDYAERYEPMLILIAAISGESTGELAGANMLLRWKGQDRRVADVVVEIDRDFTALRAPPSSNEWPMFRGNAERNRTATTRVENLGLLWRFDALGTKQREADDDNSGEFEVAAGSERERARRLVMYPVVEGGLVYVQRQREIVALHRNTGAVAWRFRADETPASEFSYLDDSPPAWDSVTVAGGRVYASIPGEAVPYYSYESARTPPELLCLSAATGRRIWRLDQDAIEEQFAEVSFDSAPIVTHGRLYVVGRRRRSFGFEDCYLYRFDAINGTLEQRTHLGSASTGTFGSRQPTKTIAALHGNTVYVCTNLGTLAAVSAHTGVVRWLQLYQRDRVSGAMGSGPFSREVAPSEFNPAIWSQGRIVFLPTDATRVMVLDAQSGKVLATIPVEEVGGLRCILGVSDGLLCGAGERIACYDIDAGSLRWSAPMPQDAAPFGRGVWTDDRLLVPTLAGLSTFSVTDGTRVDQAWDAEGEGGNLLAMPDQILVAGVDRLSAYVPRTQIWKTLRDRMSAAPTDPLPALELAEVALNNREYSKAVEVLREAADRAEALTAALDPALSRRLFDDAMMFVDRLFEQSILDAELLNKLFSYAARYAPDAPAHLRYRFRFAELFEEHQQPERAVRLCQQILRDRSLRDRPTDPSAKSATSAGRKAQAMIAALLQRHGRSTYAEFESEARRWLDTAIAAGDETLLDRIVETFPNSEAAPRALLAHGELAAGERRPHAAAKLFAKAYHTYPDLTDRPTLLRKIADAYETAGKPQHAYRWLTKAAREYPGVRISHGRRLVTFKEYRERLSSVRQQVEPSRPHITLPLGDPSSQEFGEQVALLVPRFGDHPTSRWSRYFIATKTGIRAFDTRTSEESWVSPAPAGGVVQLLIATAEVAVLATKDRVFALDVVTGARRWSYGHAPENLGGGEDDWENRDVIRTHALYANRLFIAHDSGLITCIAIETGRRVWSQTHRPRPVAQLYPAEDLLVYHVRQDEGVLVCLVNAEDGSWLDAIITSQDGAVEALHVTLDGQIVVMTSRTIALYDPDARTMRWHLRTDGQLRPGSLLPDVDAIHFSDNGRSVKKISLSDGRLLWESERLVPRGDDDMVVALQQGSVIVSSTASIAAVDAVTGLTLWRGTTPPQPTLAYRMLAHSFVVAVDIPAEKLETEGVAYFYHHGNASGLIARDGGAPKLGRLTDVRTALVADGALLIQTGLTVKVWHSTTAAKEPAGSMDR